MVENLSNPAPSELMLAGALARVPGFVPGDASIQIAPLPGGRLNRTYRVITPRGRFAARLSPAPDAWLASDRSAERQLHSLASDAYLAPRIVYADDQVLITELVEGQSWMAADFAKPDCLQRLGRTLHRLHQLTPPDCGRVELLQALEGYARRIEAVDTSLPVLEPLLEEARRMWQISGAAERSATIVHHDLHGSNLIESRDGLMLIDWECAAVADPLLDVACILSYYRGARGHAPQLLSSVGLTEISPAQLAATVWLFDLHTYLWYRERRQRWAPTVAELEAESHVLGRVTGALSVESAH
jgi:aminoglycoside phosphotransferase (APT) family kinase protein